MKKLKHRKKIVQADKKQSNQAQFKTHENEIGCNQCIKEKNFLGVIRLSLGQIYPDKPYELSTVPVCLVLV